MTPVDNWPVLELASFGETNQLVTFTVPEQAAVLPVSQTPRVQIAPSLLPVAWFQPLATLLTSGLVPPLK